MKLQSLPQTMSCTCHAVGGNSTTNRKAILAKGWKNSYWENNNGEPRLTHTHKVLIGC